MSGKIWIQINKKIFYKEQDEIQIFNIQTSWIFMLLSSPSKVLDRWHIEMAFTWNQSNTNYESRFFYDRLRNASFYKFEAKIGQLFTQRLTVLKNCDFNQFWRTMPLKKYTSLRTSKTYLGLNNRPILAIKLSKEAQHIQIPSK